MAETATGTVPPAAGATAPAANTTPATTVPATGAAAPKPPEGGTPAGSAAPGGADAGKTQPPAAGAAGASTTTTPKAEDDSLLGGQGKPEDAPDIELKLPEGVLADAGAQAEFKSLAKELGLKSDGAQKLVEFSVKQQKAAEEAAEKAAKEAYAKTKGEWKHAAEVDKEYGGQEFKANLAIANKAFEKFRAKDSGFLKLLDERGLTNHPEAVRFFYRRGKEMSEDSLRGTQGESGGTTPSPEPKGGWDSLYDGKMGVAPMPPRPK